MRGSKSTPTGWPPLPSVPTADFRNMLEKGRHPMFVSEARLARHPEEGGEVLLHICRVDEVLDHKARSMPTRPAAPRGGGGRSFARLHGGSSAVERYSSSPLQGRGAMLEAALLCISCQVLPSSLAQRRTDAAADGSNSADAAPSLTDAERAAARIGRCRRADVRIHMIELRKRSAAFQRRFVWPLTDLLEFAAANEDAPRFTLKFVASTQSEARRERRQSWKCVPRRRPSLEREAAALVLAAAGGPGGAQVKSFDLFRAIAFVPAELQCLEWLLAELCVLRGTPLRTVNVRSLELGLHGAKHNWFQVYHLHEFITVNVLLDAEEEQTEEKSARRAAGGGSPSSPTRSKRRGSSAGGALTKDAAEAAADAAMKLWDKGGETGVAGAGGGSGANASSKSELDGGSDGDLRVQTLEQEEMMGLLRSAYVLHAIDKSRARLRGVHHGFLQHARIQGGLREEESSLQRLEHMLLEEEVHEANELMHWHSSRMGVAGVNAVSSSGAGAGAAGAGGGSAPSDAVSVGGGAGGSVSSRVGAHAVALSSAPSPAGDRGRAGSAAGGGASSAGGNSITWVCRSLDETEASLNSVSMGLATHDDRLRNVTSAMKLLQKRNNLLRRVYRNQEKLNSGVEKMLQASSLQTKHAHALHDSAVLLAAPGRTVLTRLLEAADALSVCMEACKAADIEAMHELRIQLKGLAHKFAQAVCDRLIDMSHKLALSIDSRAAAERDIDFDPTHAAVEDEHAEAGDVTAVWNSESDAENMFISGLVALTRCAVERREELARLGFAVRAAVNLDDSQTVADALRRVLVDTTRQCSRLARTLCDSALGTIETFIESGAKAHAKAVAQAAHLKTKGVAIASGARGDGSESDGNESDSATKESGGAAEEAWWTRRWGGAIAVGLKVVHVKRGDGIVIQISPDNDGRVHVKFDASGDVHKYKEKSWDKFRSVDAEGAIDARLIVGGGDNSKAAWEHVLSLVPFADDRFAKMPRASLRNVQWKLANVRSGALSAVWMQFTGEDIVTSVDAQLGAAHTNAITAHAHAPHSARSHVGFGARRPSIDLSDARDGIEAWEELRRLKLQISHEALEGGTAHYVHSVAEWLPVGSKQPEAAHQRSWGGAQWHGGDESGDDESRVRAALCLKSTMAPPLVLRMLLVAIADAVRAEVEVLRTLFLSIDPRILLSDAPGGGDSVGTSAAAPSSSSAAAGETSVQTTDDDAAKDTEGRMLKKKISFVAKLRRRSNLGPMDVAADGGAAASGGGNEKGGKDSAAKKRFKSAVTKVKIVAALRRSVRPDDDDDHSDRSDDDDGPRGFAKKMRSGGGNGSSTKGGSRGEGGGKSGSSHSVHFEVALQLVQRVWSPLDDELVRLLQRLFIGKESAKLHEEFEKGGRSGSITSASPSTSQWRQRAMKWSHSGSLPRYRDRGRWRPLLTHSMVGLLSAVAVTVEAADESQQMRKDSEADLMRLVQLHESLGIRDGAPRSAASSSAAAATFSKGRRRGGGKGADGEQDHRERVVELEAEIKRTSYIAAADVFIAKTFETLHRNTLAAFDRFWSDQIAWMEKLKPAKAGNMRYAVILPPISRLPLLIERLIIGAAPFLGAAGRAANTHAGSVVTHSIRSLSVLAIERLVSAVVAWLPKYASAVPRDRRKYSDIIILENSFFLFNVLEEQNATIAQRVGTTAGRAVKEIFGSTIRHVPELKELHAHHRGKYIAWLIEEEWEQLQKFFADVERTEAKVTAANVRATLTLPSAKVLPRDGGCKAMVQASLKHMWMRVTKHFSRETQLQNGMWCDTTNAAVGEWERFATLAHDCYAITLLPSGDDLRSMMDVFEPPSAVGGDGGGGRPGGERARRGAYRVRVDSAGESS